MGTTQSISAYFQYAICVLVTIADIQIRYIYMSVFKKNHKEVFINPGQYKIIKNISK